MRRLILGTAGHVDHGKTTLVHALTGIQTDRLAEEKRRGISIELGFARLALGADLELGIVDVPGHEKFVRQMVAGAGGMDLAMLLVAADEGVMPQTREHLDILRLLGVRAGLVVLSRMDLAEPGFAELVEEELIELCAGSFLEGAQICRVSAQSGEGMDALRAELERLARDTDVRPRQGDFRLPVDRAFVLEGTGVVAAGSAWQGTVEVGDNLRLMPADHEVRVRELHHHGSLSRRGGGGERLALALHGISRADLRRGDQLVAGPAWAGTLELGLRVEAIGGELPGGRIKQRARLHVHHAARSIAGTLELLEQTELRAGGTSLARLRLEEPVVAAPGDRLVLRSWSPTLTIAGGVVLWPHSRPGLRRLPYLEDLVRMDQAGPAAWPVESLRASGSAGLSRKEFLARCAQLGNSPAEGSRLLDRAIADGVVQRLGERLLHGDVAADLLQRGLELLRIHQAKDSLTPGLPREQLRQRLGLELASAGWIQLLETWAKSAPLFLEDEFLRADQARPQPSATDRAVLESFENEMRAAAAVQLDQAQWTSATLRLLVQQGRAIKLVPRLVSHRDMLAQLGAQVGTHFAVQEELTVQDLKALTGLSRKFVVPLLEWMDQAGWTRFDGGIRRRGGHCPEASS